MNDPLLYSIEFPLAHLFNAEQEKGNYNQEGKQAEAVKNFSVGRTGAQAL